MTTLPAPPPGAPTQPRDAEQTRRDPSEVCQITSCPGSPSSSPAAHVVSRLGQTGGGGLGGAGPVWLEGPGRSRKWWAESQPLPWAPGQGLQKVVTEGEGITAEFGARARCGQFLGVRVPAGLGRRGSTPGERVVLKLLQWSGPEMGRSEAKGSSRTEENRSATQERAEACVSGDRGAPRRGHLE